VDFFAPLPTLRVPLAILFYYVKGKFIVMDRTARNANDEYDCGDSFRSSRLTHSCAHIYE